MSVATKPPLRVALVVDSFAQPRWVHEMVLELQASDVARLTLIIERTAEARDGRPLLQRALRRGSRALYALYTTIDDVLFPPDADPLAPVDIRPLVSDCDVLHAIPALASGSESLSDEDIGKIAAYDLDVALLCGAPRLRGRALRIARYGVWSCDPDDVSAPCQAPPGFREVMERAPTTCSVLKLLHEPPGRDAVISRAHTTTDARSVARNRRSYYWRSSALVHRKLRDLYHDGPRSLLEPVDATTTTPRDDGHSSVPGNAEMAWMLARLASRFMSDKLSRLVFGEQWILAYTFEAPVTGGTDGPDIPTSCFTTLIPPTDRFWADPFPMTVGDRYFVFFEERIYREPRGCIRVIEVDENGPVGEPSTILERDYHVSYPFVFEWEGAHYLMPESSENRTVELYRAKSFPDHWEPAGVLLSDINAVDATLARLGELWWMFVNVGTDHIPTRDELHLFFAESPLGPWQPHRRNPVKSDVRSARPAGRILSWHGHHYRPSQDCSESYGGAIVLSEIQRITPDEYREVAVKRLSAGLLRGVTGVHTINTAADLAVIDARVNRCRLLRSTRWTTGALAGRRTAPPSTPA